MFPQNKRQTDASLARSTIAPSIASLIDSDSDTNRRGFLCGAGLTAISITAVATAVLPGSALAAMPSEPPAPDAFPAQGFKSHLDNRSRVSRGRLDEIASAVHKAFNNPEILSPFDSAVHGATYDVELYRITAFTQVPETGETLKVSGLLAVPLDVKGPLPVVSWQHGTILSFNQVPSNLTSIADPAYVMRDNVDSMETLLNVQRLAGNGYAVIAADYIGKGPFRNGRAEAYATKGATVQTCIDILDAGLRGLKELGYQTSQLFLNGWSQGALNTQWLHQELRRQGRPIAATAVESPFNDLNESFRFWAGAESYPSPSAKAYPRLADWISLCMIVTLGSYQRQYGLDGLLQSAIRPEFHALALKFWDDYQMDFDPKRPFPSGSTLLVDGFFERYTNDLNSRFLRQLAANRATYWAYDAPIRFYYGLSDEAIHPALVNRPLSAGGRHAIGVPIAGASHRGTVLASLYFESKVVGDSTNVLRWFNAVKANGRP